MSIELNKSTPWCEWINQQEESGLSAAAFCRQHELSLENFYYHRKQHRQQRNDPAGFVRAQPEKRLQNTPLDTIRVDIGSMTVYVPLSQPIHAAAFIKALR